MNYGDVCLTHFPFTNASAAKLRPVLIVSGEKFNNGGDVVVLPISSRPEPDDPFAVYIGEPDFKKSGLRRDSSVKWAKPATIAKSVIQRRLGSLPKNLLDEVCNKVKSVFDDC